MFSMATDCGPNTIQDRRTIGLPFKRLIALSIGFGNHFVGPPRDGPQPAAGGNADEATRCRLSWREYFPEMSR
jgi:hypothetical protein